MPNNLRLKTTGYAVEQILSAIPWIVLFVVYVREKLQQGLQAQTDSRQQEVLTVALNDALKRAQGSPGEALVVPPGSQPTQPPVVLPPPVAPAGPFASAPKWFGWALHEIGAHEEPQSRGPIVQRYIDLAHTGARGDPWCAIFANAALEASGVAGRARPRRSPFAPIRPSCNCRRPRSARWPHSGAGRRIPALAMSASTGARIKATSGP
jgi:hypothetical protein